MYCEPTTGGPSAWASPPQGTLGAWIRSLVSTPADNARSYEPPLTMYRCQNLKSGRSAWAGPSLLDQHVSTCHMPQLPVIGLTNTSLGMAEGSLPIKFCMGLEESY